MPSILTRPSGGTGGDAPSVSVALSDATIDYGNTVTITATPSDIVPTNYKAFAESTANSLTYIGDQAGAVFNWLVNSDSGSNEIFVQADNGSTKSCINIGGEALTVTTNYLLNYTTFLACWSAIKRGETFSNPILRALRSSDNDEADFTPVTGTPEYFDGSATASNASPATHNGDTFAVFIGSDNGTTPDWYDQVGSYDAVQTTLSKQPTIATGGTVETISGNSCYSFDGGDNILTWNNTTAPAAWQGLSDAITIIAWVSADAITGSGGLVNPEHTLVELRVNATGSASKTPFSLGFSDSKVEVGFTDNYISGAEKIQSVATLSTGTLYQIAITIDGDDVSIYIDGQLDHTHTLSTATGDRSVGTNNSSLCIGSRTRDGGQADQNYFTGDIVDLIVASSVLTSNDILNIYNFYQS